MPQTLKNEQNRFIEATLPHIGSHGISTELLQHTSLLLNKNKHFGETLFSPHPVPNFVDNLVLWWDTQTIEKLEKNQNLDHLKIREKITQAILTKLDIASPHKDAFRQLHYYYAKPCHSKTAFMHLWKTSDRFWNVIHDTSVDFNYYSKRTILSAVIAQTLMYWFNDSSDGYEQTKAFVDRRINNVITFGTITQKIKKTLCQPI